jgi:hypothetical protein
MIAAASRATWQNPRIFFPLSMVFLAGAASGALMMHFGLHEKLHRIAVNNPTVSAQIHPIPGGETVLQRFNSELGLSPDQSQRIAGILQDYTQYYQSLQDQLDDVRATGRSQILQILKPDQKEKFDKLMSELAPQLEAPAK